MASFLLVLAVVGAVVAAFVVTHLRPLSEAEVHRLAARQRGRQVKSYFSHATSEAAVNTDFKRRMNPDGKLYPIWVDLDEFPSVAAGLLKYKKHEWVIIGFERERLVRRVWCNKGADARSVAPYLSIAAPCVPPAAA